MANTVKILPFRPLGNRILVKEIEDKKEKTVGGIILLEDDKKATYGKIVAIGPGHLSERGVRLPIDLKVGQKILMPSYGPEDFEFEGVAYKLFDANLVGIVF